MLTFFLKNLKFNRTIFTYQVVMLRPEEPSSVPIFIAVSTVCLGFFILQFVYHKFQTDQKEQDAKKLKDDAILRENELTTNLVNNKSITLPEDTVEKLFREKIAEDIALFEQGTAPENNVFDNFSIAYDSTLSHCTISLKADLIGELISYRSYVIMHMKSLVDPNAIESFKTFLNSSTLFLQHNFYGLLETKAVKHALKEAYLVEANLHIKINNISHAIMRAIEKFPVIKTNEQSFSDVILNNLSSGAAGFGAFFLIIFTIFLIACYYLFSEKNIVSVIAFIKNLFKF